MDEKKYHYPSSGNERAIADKTGRQEPVDYHMVLISQG